MSRERRKKKAKDKVLNTRIPEELEVLLKERADNLDMPVSQLVRNILHCTVELVGNISGNVESMVENMVEDVHSFKKRARQAIGVEDINPIDELIGTVLGWQEIRVNTLGRCAISGEVLEVGELAHLGVRASGGPVVISNDTLTEVLAKRTAENAWSQMQLNVDTPCSDTGNNIEAGSTVFFRNRNGNLEIISAAAHAARTPNAAGRPNATPHNETTKKEGSP